MEVPYEWEISTKVRTCGSGRSRGLSVINITRGELYLQKMVEREVLYYTKFKFSYRNMLHQGLVDPFVES